jgi:hypothetical protein
MSEKGGRETRQQDLDSVLREKRRFEPPAGFAARARIKPADLEAMLARAAADHAGFWADLARRELAWHKPFTIALDDGRAPHYRWFADGLLNVSYNCLDANLEKRGDKIAIRFEGEPGDTRNLSYRELHGEVCRFANALKGQGIRKGDRVVIYMPLIPQVVIAMQACARIGAIHSVVFGGFSAESLKNRIEDAGARLLVTGGRWLARGPRRRAQGRGRQGARGRVSDYREGDSREAHGAEGRHEDGARLLVGRRYREGAGPMRARVGRGGASAVPAVHIRVDGTAEGHTTLERGLSPRRKSHDAMGVRPARGRRLLVHGRRGLGDGDTATTPTGRSRRAQLASCTRARRPCRTGDASGRSASRRA